MKRIVSLVLALSMVLSMFSFAFAGNTLPDVEGTDYEAAVSALVELGIVNGYEDGTYKADRTVTRAEMAKFLVVSAGLEPAADVSKGATKFSDVAANHWATGYINVATEYGYINGYPEGTFAPDTTVSYAEAVTMAIRVLGFKSVVEAKGTWPTNYIAKAQELDVLEDVKYGKYTDGATRGNVALLMWNMLRTPMWDVQSENENNGLTYSDDMSDSMIEKYFEDYTYTKATFTNYAIDADGKVMVTLAEVAGQPVLEAAGNLYEYLENDFYTFVKDTEVEVLVNEEEEVLLMVVPTGADKLVEGAKDEIDDKYTTISGDAYDYAYARVKGKTVEAVNEITTSSVYVNKVEAKDDFIRVNGTKETDSTWESRVVLKDGERVIFRDAVEVGDVLTTVTLKGKGESAMDNTTFYVLGGEEVEGEFKKLAEVDYENSNKKFYQLTLDSDKYVVDSAAKFVEDPEAKTLREEALILAQGGTYDQKMVGEDVVVTLDPVTGKVVRVEFDGKIDSGKEVETTVEFFGALTDIDRDGSTYFIRLANEKGEDDYEFSRNSNAESSAKRAYATGANVAGTLVVAKLNAERKILEFAPIANYDDSGDVLQLGDPIPYGTEPTEMFVISGDTNASYVKDNSTVSGDTVSVKVNENTVLISLVFDDKGNNDVSDDEYRVEFSDDMDAIKDISKENVLVIVDADSSFVRAKYIVVFDDTSDNSDKEVAKNISDAETIFVGNDEVLLETADGEEILAKVTDGKVLTAYELLVYTLTTNTKGDTIFNYVAGLKDTELTSGDMNHGYVGECETGRIFLLNGTDEVSFDDESLSFGGKLFEKDVLEDYLVVNVDVAETDVEGEYEVSSFSTTTYANISVAEGDRISIDEYGKVIFVIRGMNVR